MPSIQDLLVKISGSKYYTKIDLNSGYYQFSIEEKYKHKTCFSTPFVNFQFRMIAQGLSGTPATFQNGMNFLLGDIDNVSVYLDDILIYNKTLKEHLSTVDMVLKTLQGTGLAISVNKSVFVYKEIEYLGFKIDRNGITSTDKNI